MAGTPPDPTFSDDSPEASTAIPAAESPAAPPRRRRVWLVVVAVAIAAVLVIALAGLLGVGGFHINGIGAPPPQVRVNVLTLDFAPSNESCFASAFQSTHAQTVMAGGQILYNVSLQNNNPGGARDCTVTGLSLNVTGFAIASSNVPLVIGSAPTTLTFSLSTPSAAFNGSVTVVANVTYERPNIDVTAQTFHVTGGGGFCGTVSASGIGFTAFSGTTYSDSALVISILAISTCSVVQLATTGAPGFSVVSSNLPVSLPTDALASMNFVLQLPPTAYSGALNFTVTLS